jgi:hypothetical protein
MYVFRGAPARIAGLILLATVFGCSRSESQSANGGHSSSKTKIDKNLTDLPAYPNLTSATMLGHPPQHGAVYDGTTNDSYETVVAWYRARLKGAKESHSGFIDTTKGNKEIEFHIDKWNEQVAIASYAQTPGTAITLGQDAHP